ncbi:unnamed protein product, partial [marine sediment metagenome]
MEVTYTVGEEFDPGEPKVQGAAHLRALFEKAGLNITKLMTTRGTEG